MSNGAQAHPDNGPNRRRLALSTSLAQGMAPCRVAAYSAGEPAAGELMELGNYATARYWNVADSRSDPDESTPAAERAGLCVLLYLIDSTAVEFLLMTSRAHQKLTVDDQDWLQERVRSAGSFLHLIQPEQSAS